MVGNQHLIIDDEAAACFSSHFPTRHFRIRHDLLGHPLLAMDRMLELALSLPRHCVEFNQADLDVGQDPNKTPYTGLSLERTIREIADCNSWVALKYLEFDPAYRQLLLECVQELAPLSEPRTPGIHQLEAYAFISSPDAVTPFHFDDEHNFLLQIQGGKTVTTWGAEVMSHLDLERSYRGTHRNLRYTDELDGSCRRFELKPGDGLHIPVHSPHWVKNGPEVLDLLQRHLPLRRADEGGHGSLVQRQAAPARPAGPPLRSLGPGRQLEVLSRACHAQASVSARLIPLGKARRGQSAKGGRGPTVGSAMPCSQQPRSGPPPSKSSLKVGIGTPRSIAGLPAARLGALSSLA